MKKLILTLMVILFTGCGGEGTSEPDATLTNEDTTAKEEPIKNDEEDRLDTNSSVSISERVLNLNEKIEVISNDIYEARSSDALIDIDHDIIANKRYVTLLRGEGVIITKN